MFYGNSHTATHRLIPKKRALAKSQPLPNLSPGRLLKNSLKEGVPCGIVEDRQISRMIRARHQLTTGLMFHSFSLDSRVPREHPLRTVKEHTDAILNDLSEVFERMYSTTGRPSVPPERLLKAPR